MFCHNYGVVVTMGSVTMGSVCGVVVTMGSTMGSVITIDTFPRGLCRLKVGDTAGWETCATRFSVEAFGDLVAERFVSSSSKPRAVLRGTRTTSSKSHNCAFRQTGDLSSLRARSLLKHYGISDCERGGCDDEARRPSISAVICEGEVTKSARPPRHKMKWCGFSTDS